MSGRKYGRLCRLILTKPTGFFTVGGLAPGGNQIIIRDLRVAFSVEKNLASEPNPAEIVIFNLSPDNRAAFQQKPLQVRLEVGYDTDEDLKRIFVGDLRHGISRKNGTEWETKLQLGDGDRAYKHARVNRSFAAGTQIKQVMREMAAGMGLDLPANGPEITGQLTGGASLHGPSRKRIDGLLHPRGMHWSIQDGRLQLLKDGTGEGSTRPEQALVINQSNGLEGSPDFGPPKEKGSPPSLSFRCKIIPELTPGGRVQLESKTITGQFKVIKVVHKGDTHGDDWYSEVEAKLK